MALINLGDSQTFNYTGSIQTLTIQKDGYYKLETYGGKGGGNDGAHGYGGRGGYARGFVYLEQGTTLYIVCGGGNNNTYNGGGAGNRSAYSGNGGGATHIATMTGLLTAIGSSNLDKILIVAGGGGGGGYNSKYGGVGGGLTGGNGTGSYFGGGGTQTQGGKNNYYQSLTHYTAGAFGKGGTAETGIGTDDNDAGGGGGGLYGGAGGSWSSSNTANGGGGGGSSYIANLIGGYTESGVNTGNGYAIITLAILVEPQDKGYITATDDGTTLSLLANANNGYEFDYWEATDSTIYNDNPLELNATTTTPLTLNFKLKYNVTLTYDNTLGNATYDWVSGTQIELVATPNSNAQFKGYYINSIPISTNTTYTYTVLSDVVIEARFERVWDITSNVSGNGSIQYTRGTDRNDVVFSVIADTNNHFVKYVVDGVEYTTTPLTLYLTQDTTITAYFEENERYHITVNSNFPYGSFYISDNDVFAGTIVTIWARPFPDYNFVRWQDGTLENPRQIEVNADITLVAEYQRSFETNGIYQYRCYIKDQLDLEAPPKAFMRVDNFDIKRDTMTKSNSTIYVMDTATNVNNGDVLVVYDPMGTNLYEGVVKSMEGNKIICSQMPSFYKGLWIYNVSPQDYLEHEIAVLLQAYADGQIYRSSYIDTLVAQRLGGITINYVGSTAVNLPTDLDDNGNEKLTQKDMEQWIYELYENYGIIFDFQINMAGANYVTIKTPSYETIKVGNNMYAIQDMSPITEIEETNRLIIFSSQKVYRTTYVATKNGVVEQPTSTNNRFDITNTKVVFSDDDVDTLIANNLPEQMYNHKLTFTLIIKNFLYEFGDFNLGGELDVWVNDDYYNTVLTGYQIKKASNQNITEVGFTCGKVRVALTKKLTMGVVL